MASYALGSIHGDYAALRALLEHIGFDPNADRLWFTGNLVGDGTGSLEVLRYVSKLGKAAVAILGKQELDLLGVAYGINPHPRTEGFQVILDAPDCAELLTWIRKRGLLHHDASLGYTMVHAGIPAEWTFSQAMTFAYEVELALSGNNFSAFLENRRQNQSRWNAKLNGWKRVNFIANALTSIGYCTDQGKLDFAAKGPVTDQEKHLLPWYRMPERQNANLRLVFADDKDFQDTAYPGVFPLAGQGVLSAIRLSPETERFAVARV